MIHVLRAEHHHHGDDGTGLHVVLTGETHTLAEGPARLSADALFDWLFHGC